MLIFVTNNLINFISKNNSIVYQFYLIKNYLQINLWNDDDDNGIDSVM